MRYELLYVIPATYAENELQPVMDAITDELKKLGAELHRNEMVGKLKLAYPVKKIRHGYFVIVDMDMEPEQIKAMDKNFRLHSDVLRHQIVVKDEKVKPVSQLTSVDHIERERPPKSKRSGGDAAKKRQPAPAQKQEKDGEKSEVDMKEIDKKLDKIVEGKILE